MATLQDIQALAVKFGERATVWKKGDYSRIYTESGRKDVKIWLECEVDDNEVTGAKFRTDFSTRNVSTQWLQSQRDMLQRRHIALWYAYVLERHRDHNLASYGPDIVGMIQEAREFEAEFEKENGDA